MLRILIADDRESMRTALKTAFLMRPNWEICGEAKDGREALKLVEELLTIAPEDAGLSKLKARVGADLVKQAVQAQKIAAATQIVELLESRIPASHLGEPERSLLVKVKESLYSM